MGDASIKYSGVLGDTTINDSGVLRNTTIKDSGVLGDITIKDSGILEDTTTRDSGVLGDTITTQLGFGPHHSKGQWGTGRHHQKEQRGIGRHLHHTVGYRAAPQKRSVECWDIPSRGTAGYQETPLATIGLTGQHDVPPFPLLMSDTAYSTLVARNGLDNPWG